MRAELADPSLGVLRREVNARIRSNAEALGLEVVDVDAAVPHVRCDGRGTVSRMHGDKVDASELWQGDGLHMQPAGYDRVADVVAAGVLGPLGLDTSR